MPPDTHREVISHLKPTIMLDAFKEFLDKIYWEGYAEEFETDHPTAFYCQFREFKINHELSI